MSIYGNFFQATFLTAITAVSSLALTECSKDPAIEVTVDEHGTSLSGASLGWPLGYASNPDVVDEWDSHHLMTHAREVHTQWSHAPDTTSLNPHYRPPADQATVLARCYEYRTAL